MIQDEILSITLGNLLQNLEGYWWSAPITLLVFLLVYFFMNPDKIAIWSSIIASLFEKISKRSARHSVASDIQSRISSYIKGNHASRIFPYGLKFKWIKGNDFSSYVEEEDVVVIMGYHDNNAKNFVNAIRQYTSKAFLPDIRHELPPAILTAAELTIQEKIIKEKRPDALDVFTDEILQQITNEEIKTMHFKFKQLDMLGYFDNIFLTESVFVGQRLQGLDSNQKNQEIKGFLNFLKDIEDESVPLVYNGDVFRVQIILVARYITRLRGGVKPYIDRAKEAQEKKLTSLYVTGRDTNIEFVDEIVDEIKNEGIGMLEWIRSFKTQDSKKNRRNAKMILFRL